MMITIMGHLEAIPQEVLDIVPIFVSSYNQLRHLKDNCLWLITSQYGRGSQSTFSFRASNT